MINKDRVILLVIVLFLLAIAGFTVFFALPWSAERLTAWGSRKLTESLGTDVSYRGVHITRTGTIIVEDLEIADPFGKKESFFYSPRVEIRIDPLNVVKEGIVLSRVSILRPAVSIYRRDDGKWNVHGFGGGKKRAAAPEAGKGKPFRLRIREVVLEDCVTRLSGVFGEEIVTVLDHRGSLDITSKRQEIVLTETHFSTTYLTLTEMSASGILTYQDKVLAFDDFRVTRDFTDIKLAGSIDFRGQDRVNLRIDRSRFDLDHLPPQYGLRHKVVGTVDLELTLEGLIRSPEIHGRVYRSDGECFRYRFNNLSCSFHLKDGKIDVTELSSDFLSGSISGDVSFYTRESPRAFRVDLAVSGIDIAALPLGIPSTYASEFNGQIVSYGAGFTAGGHSSTVLLDLERSRFRGIPVDAIQAQVLATGKGFHVVSSSIVLGGGTIGLTGDLGFSSPDLEIRTEAISLETATRILELPYKIEGELFSTVTLRDRYTRPSVQGHVVVKEGICYGWKFAGLEGDVDIRSREGPAEGEFRLSAFMVDREPIRAETLEAHVLLDSEGFRLDSLVASFGDSILLAGSGEFFYTADGMRLVTDELRFAYRDVEAAVHRLDLAYGWRKKAIEVRDCRLSVAGGEVVLSGGASWPDRVELQAEVESFPIESLRRLVPGMQEVAGDCDARLDIRGSIADPVIGLRVHVNRPGFREIMADSLVLQARYAGARLQFDRVALEGPGFVGSGEGSLPLRVNLMPFRLEGIPGDAVDLKVDVEHFDIRFIELLSDEIDILGGYLEGEVAIGGALGKPIWTGKVVARDSEGVIVRTNTYFSDLEMEFNLEGDDLTLSSFSASLMGGGSLRGSGTISMKAFRPDRIDIGLVARNYAVNQTRYVSSLIFDSEIRIAGPISSPSVAGAVTIRRGILSIPMEGGEEKREESPVPFALNLSILAENDLWIRNNHVNAEISLDMELITRGGKILPVGDLDIIRGTYTYFGSVFDIREGEIHFFGSDPIDPALDVLAVRQVWGRVVEDGGSVRVRNDFHLRVYGRYREVNFEITVYDDEGSVVPIDRQKALTLLLANMTNEEFDQQAVPSRQKFIGQIEGILSQQTSSLIQPVSRLDILELRTNLLSGDGETSRAEVTVGEYLMEDFFVSYSQDIFDPSANNIAFELYLGKKSYFIGQTDSKGTQYSVDIKYRMSY